jgi:hypothetical protein
MALSFPRPLLQTSCDPERNGKLDLLSAGGVLRLSMDLHAEKFGIKKAVRIR